MDRKTSKAITAQELHRKLVNLCRLLFFCWVITTFGLMVFWYIKGAGRGLSTQVAYSWRAFIFDLVPGLAVGYAICGLILLDIIVKAKKLATNDADNNLGREGLKKWLGIKPANFIVCAAFAAVAAMYFNSNIIASIIFAMLAVALCMLSCVIGMRPEPTLGPVSNLMKKVGYLASFIVALLGIYFNFTVWRPSDAKLRETIVGTWTRNDRGGLISFAEDNRYSSAWTNFNSKPVKAWTYGGTWGITNGGCILTITNKGSLNTTNHETIGTVEHWKINYMDNSRLVMRLDTERVWLRRRK